MNFGTWKAQGLRVLWFGGMVNPDVLAQACDVLVENIAALTGKTATFDDVVLLVRPSADGAVSNYRARLLPGKRHYVVACDTFSAARGLAQMLADKYRIRGDSSSLLVPAGGA